MEAELTDLRPAFPVRYLQRLGFPILLLLCMESIELVSGPRGIAALLVTGGCCHPYDEQAKILSRGINEYANVQWTIVNQGGDSKDAKIPLYAKPDWAKGFDVVVHNECFADLTDVEWVKRITQPHFEGVPAVVIHCAMHSYRDAKTDAWHEFLGVESHRHEKSRPFEIQNQQPTHPVMKGFPARWSTPGEDELYVIDRLMPAAEALADAYGLETQKNHVCIWTNQYGKARVFGLTTGHFNRTLEDRDYAGLIARGLLWAAGRLGSDGKPLPGYEPLMK
jgi:type 1 glutamine amidotransferase